MSRVREAIDAAKAYDTTTGDTTATNGGDCRPTASSEVQQFVAKAVGHLSMLLENSEKNPDATVVELLEDMHKKAPSSGSTIPSRHCKDWNVLHSMLATLAEGCVPEVNKSDNNLPTPMTPFVADLTFIGSSRATIDDGLHAQQHLVAKDNVSEWTGHVALLFVDISGYSKVTSALATYGAHALSDAVNGYLRKLVDVIAVQHGGDVVKFAGDAVLAVWRSTTSDNESGLSEAQASFNAVKCALSLQEQCGTHVINVEEIAASSVPGARPRDADGNVSTSAPTSPQSGKETTPSTLTLSIHIGVECGLLQSNVFHLDGAQSMQRAYHFVGGAPLQSIGDIVDCAKGGEVCISAAVASNAKNVSNATLEAEVKDPNVTNILKVTKLSGPDAASSASQRNQITRNPELECLFVHPSIVQRLEYGVGAAEMAEMRLLSVLFIHKSSDTLTVQYWFEELQGVLDAHQCPVVQLIEDDKGVHIVAAVNLFVAESNPSTIAVNTAKAIVEREIDCAVGIATGVVFCGVLGSTGVACRWDIAGSACVRSCRLMQYAMSNEDSIRVIIDASTQCALDDVSQVTLLRDDLKIKGTTDPVSVYQLCGAANDVTAKIVSTSYFAPLFQTEFKRLVSHVSSNETARPIAIVTGPTASGKKHLCERVVLEGRHFMAFTHTCVRNEPPLSLCHTIGQWFSYHHDEELQTMGKGIAEASNAKHISSVINQCLMLVSTSIEKGIATGVIVAHAELMDSLSLSFLRECHRLVEDEQNTVDNQGRWATLLTHLPLYGSHSVQHICAAVETVTTGVSAILTVPIDALPFSDEGMQDFLTVGAPPNVISPLCRGVSVSHTAYSTSGGFPGLIAACFKFNGRNYFARQKAGLPQGTMANINGNAFLTHIGMEDYRYIQWPELSPEIVSRIMATYDVLPPRSQMVLKVLASMSAQDPQVPFPMTIVSEITQSILGGASQNHHSDGSLAYDAKLLANLLFVTLTDDTIALKHRALRDTLQTLLTPSQRRTINAKCAEVYISPTHRRDTPIHCLFVAKFHFYSGNFDEFKKYFLEGWAMIRSQWSPEHEAARDKVEQSLQARIAKIRGVGGTVAENLDIAKELDAEAASHWKRKLSGDWELHTVEASYADALRDLKVSVESVFGNHKGGSSRPRLFTDVFDVVAEGMASFPHTFVQVKNFTPSLHLGKMATLCGAMGRILVEQHLATRRRQPPNSQERTAFIQGLIDTYLQLVTQFTQFCSSPPTNDVLQKERSLLEELLLHRPEDDEEAMRRAVAFNQYASDTIAKREQTAKELFCEGDSRDTLTMKVLQLKRDGDDVCSSQHALHQAFLTLMNRSSGSSISALHRNRRCSVKGNSRNHSSDQLNSTSNSHLLLVENEDEEIAASLLFHRALMSLAVCRWHPEDPTHKYTLASIRAGFLSGGSQRKAAVNELSSFLFFMMYHQK